MEVDAILAVLLGGNQLRGGKFSIVGSLIGAYTIQALTTSLYAFGMSSAHMPVCKAVLHLEGVSEAEVRQILMR